MSKIIKFLNNTLLSNSSTELQMARVSVEGMGIILPEDTDTQITQLYKPMQIGTDIIPDINNGRIIVSNCSLIETSGLICGLENVFCFLDIKDTDGKRPSDFSYQRTGILINSSGNGYWKEGLPVCYVKLDKNKTYYVSLVASGYRIEAELNTGFGGTTTYQVKKVL